MFAKVIFFLKRMLYKKGTCIGRGDQISSQKSSNKHKEEYSNFVYANERNDNKSLLVLYIFISLLTTLIN